MFYGCFAYLLRLFCELLKESYLVVALVEDTSNRLLPSRADDLRDPVTDQLVVRDLHGANVTVNAHVYRASKPDDNWDLDQSSQYQ